VKEIRVQALIQCAAPYSYLRLETIAIAFETTTQSIEEEIAGLISNGQIQARIDAQNKVIIARGDDKRDVAIADAVSTSQTFVREARSMILRVNLLENLVVYAPQAEKQKLQKPSMMMHAMEDEYRSDNDDIDGMQLE